MKCFYHNDADGRCSGYLVHEYVEPNDNPLYGREFIEINYGMEFPFDKIRKDEQVYIVDYSISPDEMNQLFDITNNIHWIDHHRTAIDKYENFNRTIFGIRSDLVAACMLTYFYVKHIDTVTHVDKDVIDLFDTSNKNIPRFVQLIADWDAWKFEFGQDTKDFITAFNSYDFSPESEVWNVFSKFDESCEGMIQEGRIMNIYRDGWAKSYMELGFETEFEGYHIFAVNLGRCNSEYFKSLPEGKYDAFMPFVFDGEQYTVSIYSKTIDVSKIALKYGGGGHKGASGFRCKELPFKKKGEKI